MIPKKNSAVTSKDVLVFLQHDGGLPTAGSLELISAGRKIADAISQKLVAIILGAELKGVIGAVTKYSIDEVISCEDEKLRYYNCLAFSTICVQIARKRKPYAFLFTADEMGRDLVPRIAYRLRTGLATDTIDLDVGDYYHPPSKKTFKKILIQIRPDFATRIAKIFTPSKRPQMATIRPGNFPLPPKVPSTPEVTALRYKAGKDDSSLMIKEIREIARSVSEIREAQAVVSIGLGILRDGAGNPRKPKEGYGLALELAELISEKYGWKTAIGSSRALIYAGPKDLDGIISDENQIGQTGRTISPDVYFALGISGAIQHLVGMQRSKKIVAVNVDEKAPIFRIAHYPILGDLYEEVPRLIEAIRKS
ncbi:MAG: electron transfer flavoprotein subunit alpha/FixB family protein [Nitrososphaerales archaeon]